MIAPVQERIPIYLAAIGPRNTELAGEIADGWLPAFFSPEHVSDVRELLEAGAAARRAVARRLRDGADRSAPSCPRTAPAARDRMRPVLALYVGGMGSRKQNFYNQLMRRYGFEDAGVEGPGPVFGGQEGRGGGRPSRRADRSGHAVRAEATMCAIAWPRSATPGSGTLTVSPMAFTGPERIEQLRAVAELAG